MLILLKKDEILFHQLTGYLSRHRHNHIHNQTHIHILIHSATYRSKSHNSMISNDYQLYLESIQREYSQHYQNSSAMIKQLSRNSRNNGSDQEERHEPIQNKKSLIVH